MRSAVQCFTNGSGRLNVFYVKNFTKMEAGHSCKNTCSGLQRMGDVTIVLRGLLFLVHASYFGADGGVALHDVAERVGMDCDLRARETVAR